MPRVPQYTAENLALRPDEGGITARLQEGRRTGAFYDQAAGQISAAARAESAAAGDVARSAGSVGDAIAFAGREVENYLGHREVSTAAAGSTKLYAELTDLWDKTVKTSDPNDPSVAARFRETVLEPKLQEFNDANSNTERGRNWTESHVASMRQNFFVKTAADMSGLAAAAVDKNIRTLGNQSSNTAFKSPDFHTVDYLLRDVDGKVNEIIDSAPNLKGAAAVKARADLSQQMREQIAKAGAIGAIARSGDPEKTAQNFADRYPELINGADAKTLAANARQQNRAVRQDQRWDEHNQKVAKQEASEARRDVLLQDIYSEDPKRIAQVNARAIVNDPALTPAAKEHMIRLVDREMKPESDARVSAATSRDLFARIYLPEGDPARITDTNEIVQARIDGKLTKADFNDLRKEIVDARSPEGEKKGQAVNEIIKAVKPAIDKSNPLMGKIDQGGALNLYRFEYDLKRKIAEYQKAGKDWRDLLDPLKPEYVGSAGALAPYQKSLTESARDAARRLTGPRGNLTAPGTTITGVEVKDAPVPVRPPRKPGESSDTYLKRIGM